ncbi:matrixin family metalloprotease [Myxococcota bacterium]|nr:matrixin family metalloprotease [Myxococcota bacterium]
MIRRTLIARLALGAACVAPAVASAYDFQGGKWAREEIPVPYYVANTLSDDVPDRDALEAIQLGYETWHQPCAYMAWEYQGRTPNDTWGAGDGQNISSWRDADWDQPSVVLGITSTITNFQGNIEDADIKYNGVDHQWAHYDDAPGFDPRVDIASVGAHESGHALGLGHSQIEGSTMWPSTGPGDTSNRSLGADDIQGVCEVYPNGGEVPDPGEEPEPPRGEVGFGGDCSMALCSEGLFCVGDGRDQYCSRTCEPLDQDCGDGYYCAVLAGGGGACARGEDPGSNLGNFGESCGRDRGCSPGFTCVNDSDDFYCTGPCVNEMCPDGYFCAELQGGGSVCARGEAGGGGGAQGEACDERGLCRRGLFCLNDELYRDPNTNEVVPYCTSSCESEACPEGYRCIDVPPLGKACQIIPSAGDRGVGEECWVNPERPWDPPSCGTTLVCVNYRIEEDMVVEKGFCTKNCDPTDCCPDGWGCAALTPVIGQCVQGRRDDDGFECGGSGAGGGGGEGGAGGNAEFDGGLTNGGSGGAGPEQDGGGGGGGGCTVHGPVGRVVDLAPVVLLTLPMLRRRRRAGVGR